MAFQFAHIETYSRKPNAKGVNVRYVIAEALREEGACSHVKNPEVPSLVFGMPLDELEALHNEMASRATMTNSKGQTRNIRQDQRTLVTVVLSHPGDDAVPSCFDDGTPQSVASVDEWRDRSIDWLRVKYGDDLKTVIEHTDEGHPHIHAYILPSGPQMLARDYHPGEQAKAESMAGCKGIEANREGDKAYRSAMREWQNDFYREVGQPCGLARIGPGRRRLSRAEWQAEQQAQQLVRSSVEKSQEIKKTAENQGLQAGRDKAVEEWAGLCIFGKMLISTVTPAEKLKEEGAKENADKAKKVINKWKKQNKRLSEKVTNLENRFDALKKDFEKVLTEKDKPFRELQKSHQLTQSILEQLVDFCSDNNFDLRNKFKLILSDEEMDKLNKEIVRNLMNDLNNIFGNNINDVNTNRNKSIVFNR